MGNTESVVVQKRLARFRPEERPLIEGVFERLQGDGGSGKVLTLESFKSSMDTLASDSMIKRVYRAACCVESGAGTAPVTGSGKAITAATSGVSREQLVVLLADLLRGTAEERAPLVLAMSQEGAGNSEAVTREQVSQFLQDVLSSVVKILVSRERLRGWKLDRMGDVSMGVKLLAEQMCSELKASERGTCDVCSLEDWVFRVSQVAAYLELLVSEGLAVVLPNRPPLTLLPACLEAPWSKLKCLLDLPTLMFLAPQLPDSYSAPWRLLFTTQLHGESFSRMVAGLSKRGPTLLLIRDTRGHVFGAFASHAWEVTLDASSSRCTRGCVCTPLQDTISTSCTSTRTSRPCPMDWEWAGSMATLACGWTATLAVVTAVRVPSAPPTAAPSCRRTRNSPWTTRRCGLWANHPHRRRARRGGAREASWTWTRRSRP
ncbi:MTOR-associated protein MEAK7 isoform X2 [Gadus chalcogrammus]|uniref:MTOR-associated protein MEAK7 isoform X2 n=1 Tax=Gadus chalcogrammus TaxID=1042646 RepID=UPI0024C4E248|nr:MTOR-associated protein MEAK7 isoform X2 [Gadus chalcogrammus]